MKWKPIGTIYYIFFVEMNFKRKKINNNNCFTSN